MPENCAAIIDSLIEQRHKLGMTQNDLAKAAQVQQSVIARFESKKLTERAASFLPLVIPVFLAAFRRADELACAMEARGYRGPGRRTKKKKSLPNRNGNVAIAASAIFLIMQVFLQK